MGVGKSLGIGCGVALLLLVSAIASCGVLVYQGYQTADQAASPHLDALMRSFAASQFEESYSEATTQEFRDSVSLEDFTALGELISSRLGTIRSKSLTSFNVQASTSGSTMDVVYDVEFEKGSGTIEANYKKEGDEWKLLHINIKSPALTDGDNPDEVAPEAVEQTTDAAPVEE